MGNMQVTCRITMKTYYPIALEITFLRALLCPDAERPPIFLYLTARRSCAFGNLYPDSTVALTWIFQPSRTLGFQCKMSDSLIFFNFAKHAPWYFVIFDFASGEFIGHFSVRIWDADSRQPWALILAELDLWYARHTLISYPRIGLRVRGLLEISNNVLNSISA